ncbi:SDR family NAD(P)-dependent oxidoreductase [Actinomycetospora flava]|uniref:SDR family NAD(P)-dependent oxidoreductase n=1 Tax=Actinomycetospora flava TaxID=3129232 RepID=A0ABU8M1S6_9PSEU
MSTTRPLALVSGGSSGIGYELARELAERGHDVAISGQSDRVHASATELGKLGVDVYPFRADAATYDGVEGFWRSVAGLGRPINVACLNVGVGVGGASFLETDLDAELRMIAINCTGTVHLAKRVVRAMHEQGPDHGERRILVVSSVSATTPTPYEPVYGPTKAFGFSFAESIREELRAEGITVTALLPGATDSAFHHNAGMGDTRFGDNSWKNDRTEVARQGIDALFAGDDHVVGGDEATKQQVVDHRSMSEPEKAARQGAMARPS